MPPSSASYQNTSGTAVATFAQNGTFSSIVDMGGLVLAGIYADAWTGAAPISFRGLANASGTGYPLTTTDGTAVALAAFGAGTFYTFPRSQQPFGVQYLILQVGTAGTATGAAGGTFVLIGRTP